VRANDLSPIPGSVHKKKRIGRGNASGHGTYSGRGIKGQASRTGPDIRIGFEGGQIPLVRALSRKRGFNNKWRVEYEPINVGALASLPANESVNPASLRQRGIVKSREMPVKILGDGELGVALTVEAHRFSATARQKIEAAGGKVIVIGGEPEAAVAVEEPVAEEAQAPRRRAPRARAAEAETPEAGPATEAESAEAGESKEGAEA
jgi:large subunit ribosomal protein L15